MSKQPWVELIYDKEASLRVGRTMFGPFQTKQAADAYAEELTGKIESVLISTPEGDLSRSSP